MTEWWNGLQIVQQILALVAIPSTIILLLQTILLLFGIGNDGDDFDGGAGDGDIDADGGFDHDVPHGDHSFEGGSYTNTGDDGLMLFSIRGIVAMLCITGWSGMALLETTLPPPVSIIIATLAGFAALIGMAYLMRAVMHLQSSGNIDYGNAIGKIGQVYIPIPPEGSAFGKITITVQEKFIEINAITNSGRQLKTGEFVRVVSVSDDGMVLVEPIKKETVSEVRK